MLNFVKKKTLDENRGTKTKRNLTINQNKLKFCVALMIWQKDIADVPNLALWSFPVSALVLGFRLTSLLRLFLHVFFLYCYLVGYFS